MNYTLERVQTLETIQCGECGVLFAVPESFIEERRRNGATWYCPNGHRRVFRQSTEAKLRRQLELADARNAHLVDQKDAAERSNRALRGVVTRQKNRAAAGVCPAGCQRHFQNLARHMHTQHPGYAEESTSDGDG